MDVKNDKIEIIDRALLESVGGGVEPTDTCEIDRCSIFSIDICSEDTCSQMPV